MKIASEERQVCVKLNVGKLADKYYNRKVEGIGVGGHLLH